MAKREQKIKQFGFFNVDKPSGLVSSTVVNKLKWLTGVPCGHMGTLDPLASGVLPVGVGNAARLFDYFLEKEKEYVAEFTFGVDSDTHRGNFVSNGEYGLMALEPCWLKANQIEAARIAMTRYIKRGGQVWIKVFPDKPITAKPAETRMGSGKGAPEYWAAVVKPGRVMFEIGGVSEELAREAMRLASHKLPIKCKFVKREEKGVDEQ